MVIQISSTIISQQLHYLCLPYTFEGKSTRRKKFPVELAEGCLALGLISQTPVCHILHGNIKSYIQQYNQEQCVSTRNKSFSWNGFWAGTDPKAVHKIAYGCFYTCGCVINSNKETLDSCLSNKVKLRSGNFSWHKWLVPTSNITVCHPSDCANTTVCR